MCFHRWTLHRVNGDDGDDGMMYVEQGGITGREIHKKGDGKVHRERAREMSQVLFV